MINPDLIKAGDQVTLASANGIQSVWQVAARQGARLLVDNGADVKAVPLNGRRSHFVIVAHQPQASVESSHAPSS
jgi:hypothetical protein